MGKTTLARTLLRRDVGEVQDRPHVTEIAQAHVLIDTPQGDVLRLWDTPGFGDSARLLKRLRVADNPLGWLMTQVWDRFTDRPFYSSQQALRNAREESDVVLYLVNAAEDPASAGYVEVEMQILGWIGKPVLLLLNQIGPPRGQAVDAAEEAAWRQHLAAYPWVRGALGLDAFARCWVQEDQLLGAVREVLAASKRDAFDRLQGAWRRRNLEMFDAAMRALAAQLAAAAVDRESGSAATTAGQGEPLAGLGGAWRRTGRSRARACYHGARQATGRRRARSHRSADRVARAVGHVRRMRSSRAWQGSST